jgi:HSP20 family protein
MLTLTRANQTHDPFAGVFGDFLRQPLFASEPLAKGWSPAVDVVAESDGYRFRFDIPGMKRDDIHVNVEDRVLTVTGERKDEATSDDEQNGRKVWRRESFRGKFTRAFQLPADAEPSNVIARYQDGVLEVTVPKAEQVKARRIEIAD